MSDQVVERVEAFVQSRFPDQFLIPVSGFSKLAGQSFGRARNDILRGAFPLPLIRQGGRNYVATPDAVEYLASLWTGLAPAQPAPRRVGAPVKNAAAKARAAVAREARRAKRAAATEGGAA